jgi:subtilase family serine protease
MASPSTSGYVMVMENQVMTIGGTSAATPSWAGVVALLNHAAGRDGSGAINDWLYTLGRNQHRAGDLPVFYDITSGDNGFDRVRGFSAGTGFDLATGWGTPNVALLVQAVAPVAPTPTFTPTLVALTPTPTATPTTLALQICPGDCNGDGMVTVDELLTAVNIGLGSTHLSQCAAVDANGDGDVTVDEIIQAANRALNGC